MWLGYLDINYQLLVVNTSINYYVCKLLINQRSNGYWSLPDGHFNKFKHLLVSYHWLVGEKMSCFNANIWKIQQNNAGKLTNQFNCCVNSINNGKPSTRTNTAAGLTRGLDVVSTILEVCTHGLFVSYTMSEQSWW